MTRENLIRAERLANIEKRIKNIESFLDEQFNYFWITGNHQTKENPLPVKEVGNDERFESLRNLAARESIL